MSATANRIGRTGRGARSQPPRSGLRSRCTPFVQAGYEQRLPSTGVIVFRAGAELDTARPINQRVSVGVREQGKVRPRMSACVCAWNLPIPAPSGPIHARSPLSRSAEKRRMILPDPPIRRFLRRGIRRGGGLRQESAGLRQNLAKASPATCASGQVPCLPGLCSRALRKQRRQAATPRLVFGRERIATEKPRLLPQPGGFEGFRAIPEVPLPDHQPSTQPDHLKQLGADGHAAARSRSPHHSRGEKRVPQVENLLGFKPNVVESLDHRSPDRPIVITAIEDRVQVERQSGRFWGGIRCRDQGPEASPRSPDGYVPRMPALQNG